MIEIETNTVLLTCAKHNDHDPDDGRLQVIMRGHSPHDGTKLPSQVDPEEPATSEPAIRTPPLVVTDS